MTIKDRDSILKRLHEDLVGPFETEEELTSRPSDVYLSGILWPKQTQMGAEDDEKLSISSVAGSESEGTGGTGEEEEVSKKGINRPSTAGISFAVSSEEKKPAVSLKIEYGMYELMEEDGKETDKKWKRHAFNIAIPDIEIQSGNNSSIDLEPYGTPSDVYLHKRVASWKDNWLITLTLVNGSTSQTRNSIEQKSLFQVKIEVNTVKDTKFIPRPPRRVELGEYQDEEDSSSALLYRNSLEYAVGHTCSAEWEFENKSNMAKVIKTSWIPQKLVKATSSHGHELFDALRRAEGKQPLSSTWLSNASNEDLRMALSELAEVYGKWIDLQEGKIATLDKIHIEQATDNLDVCKQVKSRMLNGAKQIASDPQMAEAFRLANRAMYLQYSWNTEKSENDPLIWRPFQLGFILLSAASVVDRDHIDRNTMDLLWFPTGGGKTEAYLTLIAFLIFYRRLSEPEDPEKGAGVAAVMRYTLRLLTTQQFSRAASMILACEYIRRKTFKYSNETVSLGNTPISIGLWVGGNATPNKFKDALETLHDGTETSSPKQIIDCPACGEHLNWYADEKNEKIHVRCDNKQCILYEENKPLPIYTVDDDVYREQPSLLIGTVDKFAQIARKKEINKLFSISDGKPPDLIIQDELHLISGPLGTLTGLYEVAIDGMFSRNGKPPKIIGSTATIRRANEQVRALFNRTTCQFPPPAIDADDSGFAVVDEGAPGRIYTGITSAGRSGKFTLQAVSASLLQSAQADLTPSGQNNYHTLVSYFNSLRELGGALVLMQDDVNQSIHINASRRNESSRNTEMTEELTSRRSQTQVREMLDMLNINADEDGCLDAVLATNMMSVGVDIPRLGLMIVNGQPKSNSEYIQATSRVGRGSVPGIVVSILNNAKPRDRSHYESFVTSHSSLYRDVEPTSVTPFASRARDRALHAVLVSLIRHTVPDMLDRPDSIDYFRNEAENVIDIIVERAEQVDPEEIDVKKELYGILNKWERDKPIYYWNNYKANSSLLQDAERAAALRATGNRYGNAWPTMNNLRSVEPSVRFRLMENLNSVGKND